MPHLPTLLKALLLLPALTTAFPTPSHTYNLPEGPILVVSHFTAYIPHAASNTTSNTTAPALSRVNFLLHDPRPDYLSTFKCSLSATTIYLDKHLECAFQEGILRPAEYASFKLSERVLEIKRGWDAPTLYTQGVAEQGTYWNDKQGGNKTVTERAAFYTRTADWEFTIYGMWG